MQTSPSENEPESTVKRPSQKYLLKKEQILDKAAQKFNMMGVRGATLADVAVAVDLNLTSIRHYFLKKDDLVAAAFLRSIEVHRGRLEKSKRAGAPEARVRDMMHRYFDFRRSVRQGEQPEVMIFGDLRALAEPQASEVWPKYVSLFKLIREIVADSHEFENDRQRVNARAHMLISQLMRSVFWLPEHHVDDFERVEARFIDILLNGIAAPAAKGEYRVADTDEEAPPEKRSLDSFLLAATGLINEQGYRGASVERIAAKLNVTKGSFYHHIETKDELVVACFQRNMEIQQQALRSAIRTESKGVDQAGAAVAALIHRQQTPSGPLMRNSALMSIAPDKRYAMLRQMDQVVDRFTDMVSDGRLDGSARECDARIAGQMLMAQVNSASELGKWVPDLTPENSLDLYVKPIFRGLFA